MAFRFGFPQRCNSDADNLHRGRINNNVGRLPETFGASSSTKGAYSVKAISTINVASLSGSATIDHIPVANGDLVLLVAQTSPINNGPYIVRTGAWQRDPKVVWRECMDFDVRRGRTYRKETWRLVSDTYVIGTDDLLFEKTSTSDVGQYYLGSGVGYDTPYNFCNGNLASEQRTLLPKDGGGCHFIHVPLTFEEQKAGVVTYTGIGVGGLVSHTFAPKYSGRYVFSCDVLLSISVDAALTTGFEPMGLYGTAASVPNATGYMPSVAYPELELALFKNGNYWRKIDRDIAREYQKEQQMKGTRSVRAVGFGASTDDDLDYTAENPSVYSLRIAQISTGSSIYVVFLDANVTIQFDTRAN